MSVYKMPISSFNELKKKQVVNICDGKLLGCISDIEVDLCLGQMTAIIVPTPGFYFGLGKCEKFYKICWDQIEKIGEDIILVKLIPKPKEK